MARYITTIIHGDTLLLSRPYIIPNVAHNTPKNAYNTLNVAYSTPNTLNYSMHQKRMYWIRYKTISDSEAPVPEIWDV